ncbi:alpha/beta fold hydrolase [Candidatus Cyanaurora vandensis]|uniref:alpha/beta fold hydrolase n=1 Tax=Candidatus Cyanaurora vandensis TaxID=2714958 RepID=UPI00257A9848|nr:alpha/beta fold hydrolase [Candidatus Cyanaurora vandensis]
MEGWWILVMGVVVVMVGMGSNLWGSAEDQEPTVDELPLAQLQVQDALPPAPQVTQTVIEGSKLYYAFPAGQLQGLILLFHGRNGAGHSWFRLVENHRFVRQAVGAGYAIAALDSTDRRERIWNLRPQNNLDYKHVQGTLAHLKQAGLITAQTPLLALGHSYGAAFVARLGLGVDLKAIAIANGPRVDPAFAKRRMPPTLFIGAVNDPIVPLMDVQENHRYLAVRGIATVLLTNEPASVTAERFARIPGITPALAQEIYDSLKRTRLLDSQDFQVGPPKQSGWERAVPKSVLAFQYEIESQLDECYGGHRFSSEFSLAVLEFFRKYRDS